MMSKLCLLTLIVPVGVIGINRTLLSTCPVAHRQRWSRVGLVRMNGERAIGHVGEWERKDFRVRTNVVTRTPIPVRIFCAWLYWPVAFNVKSDDRPFEFRVKSVRPRENVGASRIRATGWSVPPPAGLNRNHVIRPNGSRRRVGVMLGPLCHAMDGRCHRCGLGVLRNSRECPGPLPASFSVPWFRPNSRGSFISEARVSGRR